MKDGRVSDKTPSEDRVRYKEELNARVEEFYNHNHGMDGRFSDGPGKGLFRRDKVGAAPPGYDAYKAQKDRIDRITEHEARVERNAPKSLSERMDESAYERDRVKRQKEKEKRLHANETRADYLKRINSTNLGKPTPTPKPPKLTGAQLLEISKTKPTASDLEIQKDGPDYIVIDTRSGSPAKTGKRYYRNIEEAKKALNDIGETT